MAARQAKYRYPHWREPIAPAFVAAIAIHALLLLAVGFSVDWPEPKFNTLAVTLALTPATAAPEQAQHVAQENQLGDDAEPEPATTAQVVMQTTMTLSRELDIADGSDGEAVTPETLERELAALEQALSSLSDNAAISNPRIGSVAARRSLDAEYLARWRARVEQVGNALYRGEPPAGNGNVRLLVSVRADGTLEKIRMLQSSGNAQLDRAAQDTVVLAAPFPAFSPALAKLTPRLDIVRTWQFRSEPVSSGP